MAKILVCGGTGFVGSAIVQELRKNNQTVRVLTRSTKINNESGLEFAQGNILDIDSLVNAMKDCDTVINAAQFDNAPFENPSQGRTYEQVDGKGTETIVKAATYSKLRRILYISGAGTAEGKTENWFKAKWHAESCVRESGMEWTIFRPSWIYGPGDHSLNRMISMIRCSPVVFILGKGYRIQPIYINDIATIVSQAIHDSKTYSQIYELAGPQSFTMKQILQVAARVMKKRRLYVSIPKSVAAILFSILGKIPGSSISRSALDFITMDINISEEMQRKVQQDFKIRSKSLEEALETYLS